MNKIKKAYELSMFALAVWSFTALLLTGEFSEVLLGACYGLTGLAFLLHRRKVRTPEIFWNGLTLIVFAVAVYLARRSLFDAAIYFFMYLQIAKLFTLSRPADARWLYLVSFFQVIGAAVLTTSLTFGLIFAVYVGLLVCSLMLFTVVKDQERVASTRVFSGIALPASSHRDESREHFALRGIVLSTIAGGLTILVASSFLFTLVPRLSTQRLFQTYGKSPEVPPESAFDESIEFGTFGKINLDNAVAMYVRPQDNNAGSRLSHVRLRGVALDVFNGRAWRRSTSPQPMSVRQAFAPFTRRMYNYRTYTIIQPPGITNYLFGDTFPFALNVHPSVAYLFDPESNSAWLPGMLPKDLQYSVTSRIEHLEDRVDPTKLQQGEDMKAAHRFLNRQEGALSSGNRPVLNEEYLENCIRLPSTIDAARMRRLADEWTQGANTDFEKARQIEERFRTEFAYTLEQQTRGNIIEDFLYRARAGHCEYFATSMALMARSLQIPARVVNGYYCSEWNDIANAFIVRQRDAHSWVEIYLGDDYGWMTFDPTPPTGVGRTGDQSMLLSEVNRIVDAMKVRWYRYVIDYSYTDQIGIVRAAIRAHAAASGLLESIQVSFGAGAPLLAASGGLAFLAIIAPLSIIFISTLLWICWRLLRDRRADARRLRRRGETAIRFYRDILRLLARRGYLPHPGQTPREFALSVIGTEPGLAPLLDVTETYYAARFDRVPPSTSELAIASALLRELRTRRTAENG